ncbi:unnamed protein product, partial [marine sediment metagenome]
ISDGIVEINRVVREPGNRSKIAVSSNDSNIDPVGACVGQRGSRVRMVVDELSGERIDIVKYSDDMGEFVKNVLSPSKVSDVFINEEEKIAFVIVPDDQVSLAIGKDGHNAKLAARMTNWKIDIKSETQWAEEKMKELEEKKEEEEKAKVKTKKKIKKRKEKKVKRCKAILRSGKRCTNLAKPDSNYCGLPAHKKLDTKKEN